jgi:tetratricopeptide (TPR) repeat protein
LNAVDDLVRIYNLLGAIYNATGNLNDTLEEYRDAIKYAEADGNLYLAALTRLNIASALTRARCFDEALLYSKTALSNFETYGDRAAAEVKKTQELIVMIQELESEGV